MKGAYVVSVDPGLIEAAVRALHAIPGWAASGLEWAGDDAFMARDSGTGGLFHMYVSPISFESEGGPVVPRPGVALPVDEPLTSYLVECRWEEQFARTVRELAALTVHGVWVIDGNGVVWDARDVSPTAVQL